MDNSEILKLIDNKDCKSAKNLIIENSKEMPRDYETEKLLGLCNINLGCFDEAEENFKTILKTNKNDAVSLYYLANIYMEKNELKRAEELLLKVLELRSEYIDAYKTLCICFLKQRKFQKALEFEDKMLAINSNDEQIYEILASTYVELMKPDKAIEYLLPLK